MFRRLFVVLALSLWAVDVHPDHYWCGGTDSWNGTAGLKWATNADCLVGLGAAIPTSADDVYIGNGSLGATITLSSGNTGAKGLYLHDNEGGNFTGTLAGAGAISLSGGVELRGIITYTGTMTFIATSGTQVLTSNALGLGSTVTFNGAGGTWQFADAFVTGSTKAITLTAGTVNANGQAVTAGAIIGTGSATRGWTAGATATYTLNGAANSGIVWSWQTTTNLTWSGTPNLVLTDASATTKQIRNGAGLTLNDVTLSGAGTGGYTLASDGNPNTARDLLVTNSGGATVTVSTSWMTFRDVNFVGSTNAVVAGAGFLLFTRNLTFDTDTTITSTASGMIRPVGTSGTQTITMSGVEATSTGMTLNAPGATVVTADAMALGGALTHTAGGLDTGGQSLQATNYAGSNSNTRALTCGSSTLTFTGVGTPWDLATSTGMTLSCPVGTIKLKGSSASSRTFAGGGKTYGILSREGGGSGALIITGANTFATLAIDTAPLTITFPASTTTTVGAFGVSGTAGNLVTLASSSATLNATLSLTGNDVVRDYLSISRITAAQGGVIWNAGANSVDGGNNGGWYFPLTNRKALGMVGAGF